MIAIRTLTQLTLPDLQRVAGGYITNKQYAVSYEIQAENVTFKLQAVSLPEPVVKRWTHEAEAVRRYENILKQGYSFGAYDGSLLVGLTIAEPHEWNQSMWVWEFHVAETYRHEGIGKRLMASLAEKAQAASYRVLVCETQNANGMGIDIYRSLGFQVEGVDISYYSNNDYPDGEVAVFMKRRLN